MNVTSENSARRSAFAGGVIGALAASDACAKDVAGLFLGVFVLSGGLAGLAAGVLGAHLATSGFVRGLVLTLGLSLLTWASLLLYWDFPFASRTFVGNAGFLMFVLLGALPIFLAAFGIAWFCLRPGMERK
jgi:hypothetical protein